VVFVQGCCFSCEGCHNPDAADVFGGYEMTVPDIITELSRNPLTDGMTISGGEPFYQAAGCVQLAAAARHSGLSVWVYTGYTYEELAALSIEKPDVAEMLGLIDVLVDGRFVLAERSLSLKWRGSLNQRVLDMHATRAAGRAVELEV